MNLARLHPSDNPESVRVRKYLTGTHWLLAYDGVEVGQTPRRVVWSRGATTLYRYEPRTADPHPVPVVLVYALILRPYILDLVPGRSLVAHLLDAGLDVYLLDWGDPGPDEGRLTLDDLVADRLASALTAAREHAGSGEVTVVGHCQGGTLSAMHAALGGRDAIRNLVLLAAPIDFAPRRPGRTGLWTLWSRQGWYPTRFFTDAAGRVPLDVPARSLLAATRAVGQLTGWPQVLGRRGASRATDTETGAWLGACRWVDDARSLLGTAFEQWVRECYQQNRLVRGTFRVRGDRVSLAAITADVLILAGTGDYITPAAQATVADRLPGARGRTTLVVDAGHVGLLVGPTAREAVWEPMTGWLTPRSTDPRPAP